MQTPSIKTNVRPTAARRAVALCFLCNGLLFATWVSRIPAVQSRLELTPGTLGLVLLCLGIGAIIAMPAAGWASARYGSERVTKFCAIGCSLLLPMMALAPTGVLLGVALFCFGAVHGGFDVAMNAQAVAVEERYERPIMSSFHALWSLGGLIGAGLGGAIAAAGVPPVVHFASAAALLGGACAWFAFSRLLVLPQHAAPVSAGRLSWHERLRPSPVLLALGAVAFCVMMGEGAMADWSAIFLRDATGANEAVAAAGYAAFSLAMAAGRFSGDWLTHRLGGVTLLRASGVLAVAGLLLALLVPHAWGALIGFAAVGAGFATVVPVVFSAAGRVTGTAAGVSLATVTTLGYTGFLIGPPIIGFAAEKLGLRGALGLVVVTSSLLSLLARHVGNDRTTPTVPAKPKPIAEGLESLT